MTRLSLAVATTTFIGARSYLYGLLKLRELASSYVGEAISVSRDCQVKISGGFGSLCGKYLELKDWKEVPQRAPPSEQEPDKKDEEEQEEKGEEEAFLMKVSSEFVEPLFDGKLTATELESRECSNDGKDDGSSGSDDDSSDEDSEDHEDYSEYFE